MTTAAAVNNQFFKEKLSRLLRGMFDTAIKKYPNLILREKAKEVNRITQEDEFLIQKMRQILNDNKGVGLAAPQLGKSKKIIVIQTPKGMEAFVNPRIIKKTKEAEVKEEGCLSFPDLYFNIKRAKGIGVEAFNEKGEAVKIEAEGILARIFQHEIDHLEGILFIDRLSFWQRVKLRKKLKGLK